MTVHSLAKEATRWKTEKKATGPRDHYIIEPEGRYWRLTIYPLQGLPSVVTGLTFPEANRRRLHLSDAGYVGVIVRAW